MIEQAKFTYFPFKKEIRKLLDKPLNFFNLPNKIVELNQTKSIISTKSDK